MSEKKIDLEICAGTACWVMGAADLLDTEAYLSRCLLEGIRLSAVPCTGRCRGTDWNNPPYVTVNGKIIGGMTPELLKDYLETILKMMDESRLSADVADAEEDL